MNIIYLVGYLLVGIIGAVICFYCERERTRRIDMGLLIFDVLGWPILLLSVVSEIKIKNPFWRDK